MNLNLKIFSDGADLASISSLVQKKWVHGVTTNPSLMKKAGVKDYRAYAKEVLAIVGEKPISFEVFADDLPQMRTQAMEILGWRTFSTAKSNPIYVKIPVTTSTGASCLPLIQELTRKGIQLNVTALLTVEQVAAVCEALKGGAPSIVSVFAGRIADTGVDPMPIMKESSRLCRSAGPQVELLWASTREVFNLVQAEQAGAAIITVPPEILHKAEQMWGKSLVEVSLDTVKTFKKDSDAAGFVL
jgi:transaldolase